MNRRKILIADKDPLVQRRLADYFCGASYQIETTGSAAYVLSRILKKQNPILLLGSRFDEDLSAHELIALLKKANPELRIILVTDADSCQALLKVREEGVFYHALTPLDQQDGEELQAVVECACQPLGKAGSVFI